MTEFTTNVDQTSADIFLKATPVDQRRRGAYVGCIDLEKLSTTGQSGTTIPTVGCVLDVKLTAGLPAAPKTGAFPQSTLAGTETRGLLDVYLLRSQSMTVIGGKVIIDY